MNASQLLHKIRLKLQPSYREERRAATIQLIKELKASRALIIEKMERDIEKMKAEFRRLVKDGRLTPERLRHYEILLMFHQERINAATKGKCSSEYDVKSFLRSVMMTSDIPTMKGEIDGYSSSDPEQGCSG